jgi:multiple RNA-binding domain-containing protein 1
MTSSSRIIVKGLGPNTSETHLRNHFKEGEITDVKVMRTKDGKSRQFAFLGFRTSDQAAEAKEYYDKTFLQSSRIGIEIATKRDRDGHDRKNSEEDTYKRKKHKKDSKNGIENDDENDKMTESKPMKKDKHLDDFLEVTKSRKVSHLWENDMDIDNQAAKNATKMEGSLESENGFVDKRGDQTAKKSQISDRHNPSDNDNDSDSDESENEIDEDGNIRSVPKKMKKKKTEIKTSVFEDKRKKDVDNAKMDMEGNDCEETVDDGEMMLSDKDMTEMGDGNVDPLRLYIPYGCAEEELEELFGNYGEIMNIHIPLGDEKGGRGYAFVKFEEASSSQQALADLDQSSFQGRVQHVTHARVADKNARTKELEEADTYSGYLSPRDRWEKSRQKMMKSTAYNAAYMDQNALVDSLAQSHNLQAFDILNVKGDANGGDIAVRMAIGETKIIQDNTTFFAKHGVNMSALDSQLSNKKASRRSSTILLIKNLPPSDSNTSQDDS